jgi:hypothetical protein
MYGLPHLATNLWVVGVFTLAVTIINIPFIAVDSSLTPVWMAACVPFFSLFSVYARLTDVCFIIFFPDAHRSASLLS